MAEVKPIQAVHYDLDRVGSLAKVTSPPYDVIDAEMRSRLLEKSPYNVVRIDLPKGEDRYRIAGQTYSEWRREGVLDEDETPSFWAVTQEYRAPDGSDYVRHGLFARVRVTEYGEGRIRPHERTHAGPKRDRLELTRATKTNLSPIFSLYSDPSGDIWQRAEPVMANEPWGVVTDGEGTVNRLWRLDDPDAISAICRSFADKELLIADGHHRYETALAYANEVGGEGKHNYTLMCLVSMEDPGLTVFPTHRVLTNLTDEELERLESTVNEIFVIEDVSVDRLISQAKTSGRPKIGLVSTSGKSARQLTLNSLNSLGKEFDEFSDAYRSLDTALLETLIFKRALGASQEELATKGSILYIKDAKDAVRMVNEGEGQAAFLMNPPPVGVVREVAAAGETMPPKSTYFYPKLLTGLVFSPLE